MSEVEFIEEQPLVPRPVASATPGGFIGWIINRKWAQNPKEAKQILTAILVLAIGASALLLWFSTPHQLGPKPPPKTNWTPPANYHAAP